MRIITEPKVRLLSNPTFYPLDDYELPDHDIGEENLIATGGKVCYDSFGRDGRSVAEHVQGLTKQAHGSVLEHVNLSFFIEGISRGCSHEVVRHRHFSYSQRSTRYTEEGDAAVVLEPYMAELYERYMEPGPPPFQPLSDTEVVLLSEELSQYQAALTHYARQVGRFEKLAPPDKVGRERRKWARGKARQVLPHALETRLVMTGNLRAWRHFITLRTSRHAEPEIRRLAQALWGFIRDTAPNAFIDCSVLTVDGFIEVVCPEI